MKLLASRDFGISVMNPIPVFPDSQDILFFEAGN